MGVNFERHLTCWDRCSSRRSPTLTRSRLRAECRTPFLLRTLLTIAVRKWPGSFRKGVNALTLTSSIGASPGTCLTGSCVAKARLMLRLAMVTSAYAVLSRTQSTPCNLLRYVGDRSGEPARKIILIGRRVQVMQAVHSWMRRPPGRGTCKVHALDGDAREPIGKAWCGSEKVEIFEDLNPVGLEYGWLTYRGQAFKKGQAASVGDRHPDFENQLRGDPSRASLAILAEGAEASPDHQSHPHVQSGSLGEMRTVPGQCPNPRLLGTRARPKALQGVGLVALHWPSRGCGLSARHQRLASPSIPRSSDSQHRFARGATANELTPPIPRSVVASVALVETSSPAADDSQVQTASNSTPP